MGKSSKRDQRARGGVQGADDAALRGKTDEFRERLEGRRIARRPAAGGVRRGARGVRRTLGMRHFDVQLIGGMVLHEGKIAEMRTGEGKTLVATLPAYLNALTGNGVHIVTVNDYLAQRDADWMGPIYEFLGLTVGVVAAGRRRSREARGLRADITYGTNNEFGFDYLRDNMAFTPRTRCSASSNFAIVDEVDSILIDEARTPLIISGPRRGVKIRALPKLREDQQADPEARRGAARGRSRRRARDRGRPATSASTRRSQARSSSPRTATRRSRNC